jgi:hypothetical protein
MRDRAKQGWHWLVVVTCLAGAALAARLAWTTWHTADQEVAGGAWIWYVLTGFLGLAGLVLLAEGARRLVRGWQ